MGATELLDKALETTLCSQEVASDQLFAVLKLVGTARAMRISFNEDRAQKAARRYTKALETELSQASAANDLDRLRLAIEKAEEAEAAGVLCSEEALDQAK